MSRVYVPATFAGLSELAASGAFGAGLMRAHAVTEELRSALPDGDEEDWEYAALSAAAEESLAVLAAEDRPRRVVVAVDVEDARPVAGSVTAVETPGAIGLERVAAVHVDSSDAEPDVRAAAAAWERAQQGDVEAGVVVERCLDRELGWYARQEIAALLAE